MEGAVAVKKQMTISTLQLTLLVGSQLIASNMISLPMALTAVAGQDAWISFFYCIPYGIAIAFLMWKLVRWMPRKNIYEMANEVCGKWLGGALNAMLILYLAVDLISQLRLFSDFFNSSILQRTPIEYIILIVVLLLIYFATGTMEHLARANVIFIVLFLAVYIMVPVYLINEIDLFKLQPVLANGILPSIKGGGLVWGTFGDVIAVGAFLHHVSKPRDIYFSIKLGIICSAFMLTLWVLCIVSVVSPTLAPRMIYIGWILVQQIHMTDFLDRVDLFLISLYLPIIIIKFAILYIAVLTGIASYTKNKKFDFINVLTGLLIAMITVLAFNNTNEVSMLNNYGAMPIALVTQIIFFGCLLAGFAMRKKKEGLPSDAKAGGYGKGVWVTLVCCGIAIGYGSIFGGTNGLHGNISGLLYVCFLILCVYCSVREYGKTLINEI